MLFIYAMNGLARPVHRTLEIAGSKETGLLLFANSWSPSFGSEATSDIYRKLQIPKIRKDGSKCQLVLAKYMVKRP